ncbi:MAG TPA: peptide ABC transporter substrate-binding protein [Mycobacteriales bacterium]|nr:peptide ABC transporter substrate-binding protein [Mycobacteriales bacterium]
MQAIRVGLGVVGWILLPASLATVPVTRVTAAPARDTLVVATLQEPDSLNPFLGATVAANQLFRLTYRYLTSYRPGDNHPVPDLATSWRVSPDRLTWTFQLREGVRWSDGRPVTAADVAFTYRVVMRHPETVNAAAAAVFAEVSALDPATVEIRTREPTPTMLYLDIPIVPAHAWADRDPATPVDRPGPLTVGSGPFRLTAAAPGQFLRLAADPTYQPAPPRIGTLVLQHFGTSDAAAQAVRKGDADVVANLTPAQYTALGRVPGVTTVDAAATRFTELGANPGAARSDGTPIGDGHPALTDARVRAAIEHAIDRPTLVARVLGGHGEAGAGYLPTADKPWSWQPSGDQLRGYDPGRANQILDAAGYPRGPDGVRARAGRRLDLRLYVPDSRALYQQSATYLVSWLREIGIAMTPRLMSDTQLGSRVLAGRYDLFLGGWVLDPDPNFLLSVQTCAARPDAGGNGSTDLFLCDPEYDRLYNRQARTLDEATRAQLVRAAQERLYRQALPIVLFYPAVLEAYRSDRFTGFVRRPSGGSAAGWWSYVAIAPAAPRSTRSASSSRFGWTAGGGAALAGVLIGALVLRRRARRDERE